MFLVPFLPTSPLPRLASLSAPRLQDQRQAASPLARLAALAALCGHALHQARHGPPGPRGKRGRNRADPASAVGLVRVCVGAGEEGGAFVCACVCACVPHECVVCLLAFGILVEMGILMFNLVFENSHTKIASLTLLFHFSAVSCIALFPLSLRTGRKATANSPRAWSCAARSRSFGRRRTRWRRRRR
jgi:hypothetical protein